MPGSGRPRLVRAAPWVLLLFLCLGWNALMMVQGQMDLGKAWLVGWDENLYLAWGAPPRN